MDGFSLLEQNLGYCFKDKKFLYLALTHSSYANEHKKESNERTEFLGDAVLELVISKYLFDRFKKMPEGELTKLRAGIVCEATIARCAKKLNLNEFMFLGKGEESGRFSMRESIMADAFEAVVGAIYLDGGYEPAKKFLLTHLKDDMERIKQSFHNMDCKTRLQELIQKNSSGQFKYVITDETGPDHDKTFFASVLLSNKVLGKGIGKSKKEAEQSAAYDALKYFGEIK